MANRSPLSLLCSSVGNPSLSSLSSYVSSDRCVCVCVYLVVVYRAWATLVWSCLHIYICPVFPSVDVHLLPLSPPPSVHSKYLYFFGENCTFFIVQANSNNFFSCIFKFLASPFLLNIRFFLSVSSRLFINLYIVIKLPLSLLSFNVVKCLVLLRWCEFWHQFLVAILAPT